MKVATARLPRCFYEHDPGVPLARRCFAEALGTALLMIAVSASAIAVGNAAPADPGFGAVASLVANALAVAGVLVGLIVALGGVSGGHFNPLITVLQWWSRERGTGCTLAYVAAQIAGGLSGAIATAGLYGAVPGVARSAASAPLAISEFIAAAGLLAIVAGSTRSGKADTGPFAVGGWISGAGVALPSHCYANPAITIAAIVASGPAHLPAALSILYLVAQILGMAAAFVAASILYPVQR